MSPRTLARALDLLQDANLADVSAAWTAVHVLATGGYEPLVRRCCAAWARHALHAFQGPAADRALLRRACQVAYRYASGRATTVEIDHARRDAEAIAGGSLGTTFRAAAAVVQTCTLENIPLRTSDPASPILVPAVFDAPWLAALTGDPHAAWTTYRRHLLRAVRRHMAVDTIMQTERSTTLPIDIETVAPSDQALIHFFSRAHSVDAAIEHWRLVLWCPWRPLALQSILRSGPAQQEADQGLAVFGWQQHKRARWTTVPVAEVLRHPELIETDQRVVLARHELPPEAFHLLRQHLGYEPDIAGQVLGWWYGEDDELPQEPPPWRHTGSILPEGAGDLRDGMHCLVLVDVDDCWFVLSERALRTYAFSIRLADGEPLRFVRSTEARLEIWTATPAARISFAEVQKRFGPAVAQRARRDAAAVLVRVHRAAGV